MKSSQIAKSAIVLTACCLFGMNTMLLAQSGSGQTTAPDHVLGLLRVEKVIDELQISQAQQTALEALADTIGLEDRIDVGAEFQSATAEQRQQILQDQQAERAARIAEMKDHLQDVLSEAQLTRLRQISVQVRGIAGLTDSDIVAELNITAAQLASISQVKADARTQINQTMQQLLATGDRDAMEAALEQQRAALEQQLLGVLTSSQQSQYDTMKGASFEMPQQETSNSGS